MLLNLSAFLLPVPPDAQWHVHPQLSQTIHFTLYENITRRLNPTGKYDPQTHVVAGALSGGLAAAATTPLDVLKTVLNTQEARTTVGDRSETRGMMDAARTVYQLKVSCLTGSTFMKTGF